MPPIEADHQLITGIHGSYYCSPHCDQRIFQQLQEYGAHTRNELAMLRQFVRRGDRILDVGAHLGTVSIPFAHFSARTARIVAVEGNPSTYSVLERNIAHNELSAVITAINAIVTGASDHVRLREDAQNRGSSFFETTNGTDQAEDAAGPPRLAIDDIVAEHFKGARVDLLKVDVEGMELQALRSARSTLRDSLPVLYVEVSKDHLARHGDSVRGLHDFLSGFGYQLFRNIGPRNAGNDQFSIQKISDLESVKAGLFDVLAIHPRDARFDQLRYRP